MVRVSLQTYEHLNIRDGDGYGDHDHDNHGHIIIIREVFKKSKWKFKMAFAIRRPCKTRFHSQGMILNGF